MGELRGDFVDEAGPVQHGGTGVGGERDEPDGALDAAGAVSMRATQNTIGAGRASIATRQVGGSHASADTRRRGSGRAAVIVLGGGVAWAQPADAARSLIGQSTLTCRPETTFRVTVVDAVATRRIVDYTASDDLACAS